MKHAFEPTCTCAKCVKEAARRAAQRATAPAPAMPWSGHPKQGRRHTASRAEQYGRYLDCGPAAWDDRY
jgi:hypothetical protein